MSKTLAVFDESYSPNLTFKKENHFQENQLNFALEDKPLELKRPIF